METSKLSAAGASAAFPACPSRADPIAFVPISTVVGRAQWLRPVDARGLSFALASKFGTIVLVSTSHMSIKPVHRLRRYTVGGGDCSVIACGLGVTSQWFVIKIASAIINAPTMTATGVLICAYLERLLLNFAFS